MAFSRPNWFLDRLSLGLLAWVALLFASAWTSTTLAQAGYEWTAIVLGIALGGLALWQIHAKIRSTRMQFERLLDAVASDDLSLRFHHANDRAIAQSELEHWQQRLQQSVESFQAHRTREAQQSSLYRSILENVPVALFDVIDQERVQLLNHAARNMFRGSALIRVQSAPPPLRAAIEGMKGNEHRMVYLPELPTPTRFVLQILHSFHAQAQHRIFSAKDITLEVQNAESTTWSKVAQILAHEINNSLTPVTSLARSMTQDFEELCQLQPCDDEKIDELRHDLRHGMETLGRRSAALLRFVDDYRKVSQIPRPQRAWFDLGELLDSVQRLLKPQLAAKGIELRTEQQSAQLRLRADREQVEQCMINLVKNASAACQDSKKRIVTICAGLNDLGHLQLSVLDTGTGLAAEDLDSIFVPFFSTRAEGTGIGLSVVRQIMQAHGGRVQALNRSDECGACVRLTFVE